MSSAAVLTRSLCARNDVKRQRFARAPPGLLLSVCYHSSRSHFLPEWGFLCSFISFLSLSQLDLKHSVYSTIKGPWCIKSKDPGSMKSGSWIPPTCCSLAWIVIKTIFLEWLWLCKSCHHNARVSWVVARASVMMSLFFSFVYFKEGMTSKKCQGDTTVLIWYSD